MSDGDVRYIKVSDLRLCVRDVLEAARFHGRAFVVTNGGQPVACIGPLPNPLLTTIETRIANDLRTAARDLLNAVRFGGQSFVITTHGRPMALVGPVSPLSDAQAGGTDA